MIMRPQLVLLLMIFIASVTWLYVLLTLAPATQTSANVNFPNNFDELKMMSELLREYMRSSFVYVTVLFASAYLFKQTFAIPGSVFMNVLAGAVFGIKLGFPLCCVLTAIGASFCYLLARMLGQELAKTYFPKRLDEFKKQLQLNRDRVPYFLLFLRLFPVSPNWAINMSCGVLEVPLTTFFLTVLIGLMPYNYICCQTGELLVQLTSLQDIFTWTIFMQMTCIAVVALLPGLILKKKSNMV